MFLDGSTILVSGGSGSFGQIATRILLNEYKPKKVIVFSRDEYKQAIMAEEFNDDRLRFFIGDIRQKERLDRAFEDVDIVIHAAALKRIETTEYNSSETIFTNVLGSMNVINAALDSHRVKKVIALSTDKACSPCTLYGATKLCMEKMIINANLYRKNRDISFSCTRYGNVINSKGNVVELFKRQTYSGKLTVTHKDMTRFFFSIEDAVKFTISSMEMATGGEIFIPKIPSMKIVDLAKTMCPNCSIEYIGLRSAEKIHEMLISVDEGRTTVDLGDRYAILPQHFYFWNDRRKKYNKVEEGFEYSSDTNNSWITSEELKEII